MRRLVFTLATVGVVFLLGTAASAGNCGIVTLGSADTLEPPPNNDANYSLVAIDLCDGTAKGQWQDTFAGGFPVHVKVTCVSFQGDDAWISGVVTKPKDTGFAAVTRLRDNGTSQNDPPDQASFIWVFWDGVPVEPDDCHAQFDLPLFDLVNGQVRIH